MKTLQFYILLGRLKDLQLIGFIEKEIIIVNDCSKDDTGLKIKKFMAEYPDMDITYIRHEKNKGKGAAVQTGISKAKGEFLIIQDADLEYDPQDFNALLKPVLDGHADIVYSSRFIGDKPHRVLFFWHTIGNKFLTTLSNIFSNLNLTDMESCYKLFNTKILQSISLHEQGFGFEPEVTAKVAKIKKIRIYEVGISYCGRTYEEGKKITWKDGLHAIYCILKYNF